MGEDNGIRFGLDSQCLSLRGNEPVGNLPESDPNRQIYMFPFCKLALEERVHSTHFSCLTAHLI